MVKDGGAEAAAHAVTVDLHHIEPGFDSQHGGLAEALMILWILRVDSLLM